MTQPLGVEAVLEVVFKLVFVSFCIIGAYGVLTDRLTRRGTVVLVVAIAAGLLLMFGTGCAGAGGGERSLAGEWTGKYGYTQNERSFEAVVGFDDRFRATFPDGSQMDGSLRGGEVDFDWVVDEPYRVFGGRTIATRGIFTMWRK